MKKFSSILVAVFTAVVMLTSCLGDSDDKRTYTTYGIMKADTYLANGYTLFYVSDVIPPIYSTSASELFGDTKPLLASAVVNYDSGNNADYLTKGYTIAETFTPISDDIKYERSPYSPGDIKNKLGNEVILSNAEIPVEVIQKHWFVGVNISNVPKDSNASYYLTIDMEPTKDSSGQVNIYDAYLKVELHESDSSTKETFKEIIAFDLTNSNLNSIYSNERSSDKVYFGIRLNYVKEFEDDTVKSWSTTEGASIVYVVENIK